MVKFHNVFLITSLSMSLNLFTASENENAAAYSRSSSFGDLQSASLSDPASQSPVILSRNNSFIASNAPETPSTSSSVKTASTSGILTKIWYGTAAAIGKSRGTIFLEMAQAGTLEADLTSKPKAAEDRLRDAAEERFKERNLQSMSNQQKIADIFKTRKDLAEKSGKSFQLDQQRAEEYNPLLGHALQAIVEHHATVIQPQLDLERNVAIANANTLYDEKFAEHLSLAQLAASNKRDLNEQAKITTPVIFEREDNFKNATAYEFFLQSIRDKLRNK
jgi:hypothetical protein